MEDSSMIKTCQICGDIKPLAEFSRDCSKKDGHQCLVCGAESDITLDHIFNYAQRSRD